MNVSMRATIFMGGGLIALAVGQVLGFDLSAVTSIGRLKSPLVMFMALFFSIGITAIIGAAVGLRALAASPSVSTSHLLWLGALFGAMAYALFVPLLEALDVVVGGITLLALAAAIAALGGTFLGRDAGRIT